MASRLSMEITAEQRREEFHPFFHLDLVEFYPTERFSCVDVPAKRQASEEVQFHAKARFSAPLALRQNVLARPVYLVLDLDETLVSYFQGKLPPTEGFSFSALNMHDGSDSHVVYPSELPQFISALAQMFKLKVSSMGSQVYVQEVIRVLDPARVIFGPDDVVSKPPEGRLKKTERVGHRRTL